MATPNQLTPEQLAKTDIQAGFPLPDVAQIVAIQLNQSGGVSDVVGWDYPDPSAPKGVGEVDTHGLGEDTNVPWTSYDTGISQINSGWSGQGANTYDPTWIKQLEDPLGNAEEALSIFQSSGWGPWSGDPSLGSSQTNFPAGEAAVNAATGQTINSVWGGDNPKGSGQKANPASTGTSGPTGSTPSSAPESSLSGLGGILQQIDQILNPSGPGTLQTITSLGTANIASFLEQWIVRLLFTFGFMGITYLGIKTMTGGAGGTSIIEIAQRQSRQAQSEARLSLGQQESARKAQAQEGLQERKIASQEAISQRAQEAATKREQLQASAATDVAAEARRRRAAYTRAFNRYTAAGGNPNKFRPPK